MKELFTRLADARSETEVSGALEAHPLAGRIGWHPLQVGKGDGASSESNFSVIENQQSSPVAALIEKITNSIDAILMRKCFEAGIDPRGTAAPRTMADAIDRFFSPHQKSWHLGPVRR